MQRRRRYKPQPRSLEERLADRGKELREQATALPPGIQKEALLELARQADIGARMSEWLRSPGHQLPE
ncbi:hypothetical protein H8A97_20580 [Bradyrhizobium sp. Arg62]|uniref:hypothetical protein n=1 Tax=Bradyrhizobium brasilense TaxID=1419277 RepID=UPI001E30F92D|nr:hypothetical protein [Bradyrhizobium brasilense]MCC8947440.1 hypothetical protein [Bradyrhizobium brasilense]